MSADEGTRWIGRRIGAYEIVALLGTGGMSEVYRARRIDAEYEKEVAIKLVPPAYAAGFVPDRLRAEQQILARLDHPNIARLIDWGTTAEGLPWLIMDLIDGEPLDQYCERRKLPVRERLRLFRDVCSAVSYAHQQLVVHRDLKPSNILVTADGTVKLLDFGIAKLMEPGGPMRSDAPTVLGMQPLTLAFASPEQLRGQPITTASDVYSLGVLLYLLLTKQMPHAQAFESQHDAIRAITEAPPLRPSAVAAARHASGERLDEDLDAIALRALREEPEKRYRSVAALSEDIANHLDARPVSARGDQFTYRAGKFLRRHASAIAASALIVATLIGGIITSLRQARIAALETARAERHVATVREFAEAAMFDMHDAIKDLSGSTAVRELLVSTALQYLNALAEESSRDPTLRRDIAMAYLKVADLQGKVNQANTGEPVAALDSYAKAVALLEPIVAADASNITARNALAQAYLQQSRLLVWMGDPAKAITLSAQATATFGSLATAKPTAAIRRALANACRVHGVNLALAGANEVAIAHVDRAVDILEALHREHEDDRDLAHELGVAYASAADVHQAEGRPESLAHAYSLRLKALAINEHLVAVTDGNNATYARSLFGDRANLCSHHSDAGEYLQAIEFCRAAQPLLAKLRNDANNAQIELDATLLRLSLGTALLGAGRLVEAAAVFEENVSALKAIAQQADTLQVQYILAPSEQALGDIEAQKAAGGTSPAERLRRWRAAQAWYEDAVQRFQKVASTLALTAADKVPIDKATAGLSLSRQEIATLAPLAE